jgi:hypothetical protein
VTWERVDHCDPRAVELADRHYSRRKPGTYQFTPPGEKLVLWHDCGTCRAVWAAVLNMMGASTERRLRCTMFRREGDGGCRSSDLIRLATSITLARWPGATLRTEVDTRKVRRKRDPGRCFRRAGWRDVPKTARDLARGLIRLEAPA